jgi:hypothetical protein
MSNAIRADDRQLTLEALDWQQADLRRKAASRQLAGERYASRADTTGSRRTAQRSWPPNWRWCLTGDYVLISGRREGRPVAPSGRAGTQRAGRGHKARRSMASIPTCGSWPASCTCAKGRTWHGHSNYATAACTL